MLFGLEILFIENVFDWNMADIGTIFRKKNWSGALYQSKLSCLQKELSCKEYEIR